jgi:hypothetical protein
MIKYFLLLFVLFVPLNLLVGDQNNSINLVTPIGGVLIDASQPGSDYPLTFFTINSNTKSFILTLKFKNGGRFCNSQDTLVPFQMKLIETGIGKLGKGITSPNNKRIDVINNKFIWKPENQTTPTVNYTLKIVASWYSRNLSNNYYRENITSNIHPIY